MEEGEIFIIIIKIYSIMIFEHLILKATLCVIFTIQVLMVKINVWIEIIA